MQVSNNSTWKIDPGHSTLQFKIKHLGIANVTGTFDQFEGQVQTDREDFHDAAISFTINANSLNTRHADRDAHLRSDAFFDVQQFPDMKFSGRLQKTGDDYVLAGELTIRNVTQAVQLQTEFTGVGSGRFGDTRAGFSLQGKISRKDYGLSWNMLTETGGFVVGEMVNLIADIELIKI